MFQDGSNKTISSGSRTGRPPPPPVRLNTTYPHCVQAAHTSQEDGATKRVMLLSQVIGMTPGYNTPNNSCLQGNHLPSAFSRKPNWPWHCCRPVTLWTPHRPQRPFETHQPSKRTKHRDLQQMTRLIRFALSNFKYLLTLFSKFFSSFPHGTCSLSVSRQYLALDGAYHPFSAGVPTYTTLRIFSVRGRDTGQRRDSHPLWYGIPARLRPTPQRWMNTFRLQPGTR